jgi:hypothetical protein
LTEQMDLYIGVVVLLMFLAGCFFIAVSLRERSEERRRLRGSTVTQPRLPTESKPR